MQSIVTHINNQKIIFQELVCCPLNFGSVLMLQHVKYFSIHYGGHAMPAASPLMGIELHHIYKSTHSQPASY